MCIVYVVVVGIIPLWYLTVPSRGDGYWSTSRTLVRWFGTEVEGNIVVVLNVMSDTGEITKSILK
jgi:hypothetical protein